MKNRILVLALMLMPFLAGCGIQSLPQAKNATEAALAEVNNQYKRRADLIPNLVNVVKGYAKHEEATLTAVTEARAKATAMQIDPSKVTPEQLAKFQQAQSGLSQALGRLMVVSEQYPQLKADQNFRDLQAQLEGTENRITIARQRYIETINAFNNQVSVPPTSWTNAIMYHFEKMPQWDMTPEEKASAEKAPEVKF
ncbi:LemA family protein [Bdellovibrio bacteriovorus]|uniref:Probable lipoprotein n=1 Tax=Bdellovibrio bacteriovorus (strain ATCC 15356 / DSM 50701 / NCIMB 9529 / HD100) TaxID=264462 RepID=Q6MNN7_BDEBA|nr:LemA family protein [Bdellovibrio bacteriovorus]AHZ86423.1 LemA family protein [Bdellovibrio bacteriovorus]BEV67664.1 Protein LemA [Bdellovibrio bacteriovorus]CAE79114.1 probable lipoprotein [Bdellovibrio bacteriovorus HD100]